MSLSEQKHGEEIKLQFFRESSTSCAFIEICKSTIVENDKVQYITGKIKGITPAEFKGKTFLFEGSQDNVEMCDLVFDDITTKKVLIPVLNQSNIDIKFKRGERLGILTTISTCDGELPIDMMNDNLIDSFPNEHQIKSNHASTCVNLNEELSEKLHDIVNKYQTAIERIPLCIPTTLPIEHRIDLSDDIPVNLPSRRLPYSLHAPVKEEINKLLSNDFIEHSDSQYASPIVPIVKKNGSVKIAIDYRLLNKKTVPRPYPIPHPDDLFNKVKGSKVFSVLDLQNGYFHIPVKQSDRHKTAFILPFGKFQWKRLALGLIGAPYTFCGAMFEIFSDMPYVVVYFDDILIFSNTVEEHLSHLKEVFDRLIKYGLHINKDKSQLCLSV